MGGDGQASVRPFPVAVDPVSMVGRSSTSLALPCVRHRLEGNTRINRNPQTILGSREKDCVCAAALLQDCHRVATPHALHELKAAAGQPVRRGIALGCASLEL